jgi:hypothetical protein
LATGSAHRIFGTSPPSFFGRLSHEISDKRAVLFKPSRVFGCDHLDSVLHALIADEDGRASNQTADFDLRLTAE